MTTITINRDVFAQHIQGLIEVMRMPNSEHVADAHNKAVRFLHAALAAQPSNYSDWQQRRGVLADIVDEALASYEAWMAEDDYNATDALHKIMDHMRQRAASYAKPAQQLRQHGTTRRLCRGCGFVTRATKTRTASLATMFQFH